jgi:Asp-tRNA(Asn)/Glu-tRNA(Gln) amidotransferase A subunit family amidase
MCKNLIYKRSLTASVLSFSIIFLIAVVFTSTKINAQTRTPTPTPNIPEIISQDSDVELIEQDSDVEVPPQTTTSPTDEKYKALSARLKTLENRKVGEYDDEQKKLLLSLDILTKTEERAENLRKKLIELVEKETEIQTKLEAIEYNLKPENIESSTALYGSLRPEEIREQRKINLQAEKRNFQTLLSQIQASRVNLEESVRKADLWVEKVRKKFEKQIDKALDITDENTDN